MLRVIVNVQSSRHRDGVDLELPAHIPTRALSTLIALALGEAPADEVDESRCYLQVCGEEEPISGHLSLADAGIWTGSYLELACEIERPTPRSEAIFYSEKLGALPLIAERMILGRRPADEPPGYARETLLDLRDEEHGNTISRKQAQVEYDAQHGRWHIIPFPDKPNPLVINEQEVTPGSRQVLRDGDHIQVGGISLQFRCTAGESE